jgi:hypothetical protein
MRVNLGTQRSFTWKCWLKEGSRLIKIATSFEWQLAKLRLLYLSLRPLETRVYEEHQARQSLNLRWLQEPCTLVLGTRCRLEILLSDESRNTSLAIASRNEVMILLAWLRCWMSIGSQNRRSGVWICSTLTKSSEMSAVDNHCRSVLSDPRAPPDVNW